MRTIELYACLGHTDTTEGRGAMRVVCYADSAHVAHEIVRLKAFHELHGVMGTPLGDYAVRAEVVIVFASAQDYLDHVSKESVRQKALAKLTQGERDALGLR